MRTALLCSLSFLPMELFAHKETILGYWYHTEKKGTSVSKVYLEDGLYKAFCFTYTNAGVTQENDRANPDKTKRGRSMKGVVFLYNLSPSEEKGQTLWAEGRLYNPRDGNEYKARAFLTEGGNILNLRVSLDELGLMGVTLQWERALDPKDIALYDSLSSAITPIHALE